MVTDIARPSDDQSGLPIQTNEVDFPIRLTVKKDIGCSESTLSYVSSTMSTSPKSVDFQNVSDDPFPETAFSEFATPFSPKILATEGEDIFGFPEFRFERDFSELSVFEKDEKNEPSLKTSTRTTDTMRSSGYANMDEASGVAPKPSLFARAGRSLMIFRPCPPAPEEN